MAYNGIHIKPPKAGSLHKLLGDSAPARKKKMVTAKKFNHSGNNFNKLMGS